MSSQKRNVLSIKEKKLTVCRLEQDELGLSHSSVSTIWKKRDAIKNACNENCYRRRNSSYKVLNIPAQKVSFTVNSEVKLLVYILE